jgi:hypothetical protein
MSIDPRRLVLPLALAALAGCTQGLNNMGEPTIAFGEMNRQTMAAQVINPESEYDSLVPATSAEHAAQATDRYRSDTIKPPVHVPSTTSLSDD